MKNLSKYQTYFLMVVWKHFSTRKSLTLQAGLIFGLFFLWDFWLVRILLIFKIALFIVSAIWILLRNARLLNYEFRMFLFEFAPSYFEFPIFENPQNYANNAINDFVLLRKSEPIKQIGEGEQMLKLEAKEIIDQSLKLYKFEKTKIGNFIVNDQELTEIQINNRLASYKSKLLPDKPSPTILRNIEFWQNVKNKVLELKANDKAILDHNFRLESFGENPKN